jgi:hypothetical protein
MPAARRNGVIVRTRAAAILTMKKIEVAEVERAAAGAERPVASKR